MFEYRQLAGPRSLSQGQGCKLGSLEARLRKAPLAPAQCSASAPDLVVRHRDSLAFERCAIHFGDRPLVGFAARHILSRVDFHCWEGNARGHTVDGPDCPDGGGVW
jgi:hypothetical protein